MIAIIILSVLLLVSIYIIYRLTNKGIKQQDIIYLYSTLYNDIGNRIKYIDTILANVDEELSVIADLEVSGLLLQIKTFETLLQEFNNNLESLNSNK